jgi:hypothetical protein
MQQENEQEKNKSDSNRENKKRSAIFDRITIITALVLTATVVIVWIYRVRLRAHLLAWRLMRSESRAVQMGYFLELANLRDESAGAAARLLQSPDPSIRILGIGVLKSGKKERSLNILRKAIRDKDPHVRAAAVVALGGRRAEGIEAEILELALNDKLTVSFAAISAMGNLDTPESRNSLIEVIQKAKGPERKARAIETVARTDSLKAGPALVECLTDESKPFVISGGESAPTPDDRIADIANRALEKIYGKDLGWDEELKPSEQTDVIEKWKSLLDENAK